MLLTMRLRSVLPLGLLAVSALALAAQAMTLKWTPKTGDKMTYKVTGTFDLAALGGEIKLTGTQAEEVKSVDADNIVVANTSKMTANAMGNEIPVPEATETVTTKLDGTVTEVKVNDAVATGSAMRLARVTMFIWPSKPVAVGDSWTAEGTKDEKADVPGYKIDFKLVGDEKVDTFDTWKVSVEGGETEGETKTKISGTVWIDKKDGSVVKSLSKLTDAVFPGSANAGVEIPPLSGTMEIVRQP